MVEPIRSKYDLRGCLESRQGGRSENQDFAGVAETPLGTLIVVCDGMGGMQGGSTASRIAVTTILEYCQKAGLHDNPSMVLVQAIQAANTAVWQTGQEHQELRGMGTTVTALLINNNCAIAAHVGDSRIYQLRKGKKVYRSFDHSMVFEMVKNKVITEEQARLSAQSNIIMKALGIKPEIEVNTHQLSFRKGDRFILCTDGFWGVMPEVSFIELVSKTGRLTKVLESGCNTVEATARKKGDDYDNLTAALIETYYDSKLQPKMNTTAKIIIAVLAALLLASMAFNIFGNTKTANDTECDHKTHIDTFIVTPDSTVLHLSDKSVSISADSAQITIARK